MKEIKFRAWDEEIRQIVYPHKIDFNLGYAYYFDSNEEIQRCETSTLMQSTGLQDKNGVSIYEGDIVKTDTDNIVSVEYDNYYGAYLFGGFLTNQDEIYKLKIEVIGNLYENPELLANN